MHADETIRVMDIWLRSGDSVYTYLPSWSSLSDKHVAEEVFTTIAANCDIYVGVIPSQYSVPQHREWVTGFLAMNGAYIDRLYIHPDHQRQGWGKLLLDYAKSLNPAGLELHTHQENAGARALYEREGFVAVKFGMSPPPDTDIPDVEYHWRPAL